MSSWNRNTRALSSARDMAETDVAVAGNADCLRENTDTGVLIAKPTNSATTPRRSKMSNEHRMDMEQAAADTYRPTEESMGVESNDPNRSNRLASKTKFFGLYGRYGVEARHCPVVSGESGPGSVQWSVWDANSREGYGPTVIRQSRKFEEVMAG